MSRLTVVLAFRKLLQIWTENLLLQLFFSSQSKRESDRDQNVVHTLRDRAHFQKILERKVDSAVRGERMAQQKLYGTEAEVEARNWEKRNSDIAFRVANQWADRLKETKSA